MRDTVEYEIYQELVRAREVKAQQDTAAILSVAVSTGSSADASEVLPKEASIGTNSCVHEVERIRICPVCCKYEFPPSALLSDINRHIDRCILLTASSGGGTA